MMSYKNVTVKPALIITAATIGSGAFALPYVTAQAGWLMTFIYFAVLGAMVIAVHAIYLKILAAEHEKVRLLGLGKKYFGALGFWFGFVGIVVGLLVSFVIFLILGTQFVQLLFPSLPHFAALFIFWLFIAIPTLITNRRAVSLEVASVLCVAAVIVFVFISSYTTSIDIVSRYIPAIDLHNLLLPFSIVIFALAGWTGVEPFYESESREALKVRPSSGGRTSILPGLALGTVLAIALYAMFAAGIIRSAPHLTTDTISGLAAWPFWKRGVVAVLGLFAITTVSMPISHEIRNALEKDLHWNRVISRLIIICLPPAVVLSGFNNFILAIGLAGGVFVSMEYLLIIAIAERALVLSVAKKFGLNLIGLVFLAAALYEIVSFIVK
jgi:amino acid permease